MKLLRIIYNKFLPALFWIALLLAFDSPYIAVLTLLCAAWHELGHMLTATLVLKRDISMPKAVLYGLKIDTGGIISYKEELFIALGGPLANILAFLALLPVFRQNEYVIVFAMINLLTAISNLLPLRSYDGQRAISSLLCMIGTPYLADRVIHAICLTLSAAGCFLSLFLIGYIGDGYWIFGVFFVSLLGEILSHRKKNEANKKRE